MIRPRELTLKEFSEERDEWDSLATRDPSGSIFDTWEWLYSYWTSREKQSGTPFFVEMRNENGLKSAAAFRIRRTRGTGFGVPSNRTLEFLAQGALTDYNTVLVSPGTDLSDISSACCDFLLRHSPSIDEVDLKEIRNGPRTLTILNRMGTKARMRKNSKNFYISLCKDWEAQKANFPTKIRQNIARYERMIKKDYPSVEFIDDHAPSEEKLDAFFDLHKRRMQVLSKHSTLSLPENIRFHKLFARYASEKGWLRLHYLVVAGDVVAATYGFAFNRRFCPYGDGFLSDFSSYSPISLLCGKSIRSSIGEGLIECDFLRGELEYKSFWTEESRYNYGLRMVSRRPLSILKKAFSNWATLAKGHP